VGGRSWSNRSLCQVSTRSGLAGWTCCWWWKGEPLARHHRWL